MGAGVNVAVGATVLVGVRVEVAAAGGVTVQVGVRVEVAVGVTRGVAVFGGVGDGLTAGFGVRTGVAVPEGLLVGVPAVVGLTDGVGVGTTAVYFPSYTALARVNRRSKLRTSKMLLLKLFKGTFRRANISKRRFWEAPIAAQGPLKERVPKTFAFWWTFFKSVLSSLGIFSGSSLKYGLAGSIKINQ